MAVGQMSRVTGPSPLQVLEGSALGVMQLEAALGTAFHGQCPQELTPRVCWLWPGWGAGAAMPRPQ